MQRYKTRPHKSFRLENADRDAMEGGIHFVDDFFIIFDKTDIPTSLGIDGLIPNDADAIEKFAIAHELHANMSVFGAELYSISDFSRHLYLGLNQHQYVEYFAIPENSIFACMLLSHWVEHNRYDFETFYENISKEFKAIL